MADLPNAINNLAKASAFHTNTIDHLILSLASLVNTVDKLVDRYTAQQVLIDHMYDVLQKEGLLTKP